MSTLTRTLVLIFLSLTVAGASAEAASPSTVIYEGQLENARQRPLGGVFPLTFSLYRTQKSTRAAWSESHFVAVQDGVYSIELGMRRPIPPGLKLDRAFMGVSVTGGQEILREKLRPDKEATEAVAQGRRPSPETSRAPAPKANSVERKGAGGESYAEIAGFAYEADRAKSADSVGGLSAEELRKMASKGKGKITVGGNKRYSTSAGGPGGQPYTIKCPKGYVVTGIRGGAAAYVDSLTLICSPLE